MLDGSLGRTTQPPVNPAIDQVWGPDSAGYSARDIADGATYAWEDISATGYRNLGEQPVRTILGSMLCRLDLRSLFDGQQYTTFSVSSNGFIRFDPNDWVSYYGELPANHYQIAPFKFDQYHQPESHYYYQTLTNPNRLVMSFNDLRYYNSTYRADTAYTKTFQIVLYENGMIKFNYQRFGTVAPNQATLPYVAGIDNVGDGGMNVYSETTFTSGLTQLRNRILHTGAAGKSDPGKQFYRCTS